MKKTKTILKIFRFREAEKLEEMERVVNEYCEKLEHDSKVVSYTIVPDHTEYHFIYDVLIEVQL